MLIIVKELDNPSPMRIEQLKVTKGFFLRAGDLTFLKTNTQLQIWFDDVLEVTWIYEDLDESIPCYMRYAMTGMKFQTPANREDKVSTHYRYEIDTPQCTGLDPAWNNIRTETTFPVDTGTELTVTCEDEFLLKGSDTVTCTDDTTFNSDTTPACVGTTYSEWIPVPADKSTLISEIKEGKKFQIRTDKKIDGSNDIRWTLEGVSWFIFTTELVNAARCGGTGQYFTDEDRATKGFFLRAGDLTFLKTNTQLQIWFDDVLEVTWIYEDTDASIPCTMKRSMTGLRFVSSDSSIYDDVTTLYRYEIEVDQCTGLDPAWNNIRTETTFPVDTGTELTVTCEDEFLQRGSYTVTCTDDTNFNSDTTPACAAEKLAMLRVSVTMILLMSLTSSIQGTTYSEWIPVPADKSTLISEIKEGKKFQISTDKKIDGSNDIRWTLAGGSWFTFDTGSVNAAKCGGTGKIFTDEDRATKGFFLRAGDLTFLKTNTQLQIWFDDVLEVTWIYEDVDTSIPCYMRRTMTGLQFKTPSNKEDKVSTHYRYGIVCTGLNPAWKNIRTETTFPVNTETELTVTCEDEFLLKGSDTVTCTDDTTFNSDTTPACVGLGEYKN
ncbi:hypothetical protein ACHWQZ_G000482 [Mnemiopsis leidyi]